MRSMIALAAVLIAASPAVAADPAPAAASDEDKVTCKRVDDGNTGSTFKRWTKVCKKKSEWLAAEDETYRASSVAASKSSQLASDSDFPEGMPSAIRTGRIGSVENCRPLATMVSTSSNV